MKEYRSLSGERRLWFEEEEIQWMMEDELREAGLAPTISSPAVDLEALLEIHLGVKLDLHARLQEDVLGVTQFLRGKRPLVSINGNLTSRVETEEVPIRILGRFRATLAHEAAHVILHRRLYDVPLEQGSFFPELQGPANSLVRCLKQDISFTRRNFDWKEVQANRGMAALLMPRQVFVALVRDFVEADNNDDSIWRIPESGSPASLSLLVYLNHKFEVSQEAARIRLESLGLIRMSNERMLD